MDHDHPPEEKCASCPSQRPPSPTPPGPPLGDEPFWIWAVTLVGLLAVFALDLWAGRRAHEITMREAGRGVAIYVGLAVLFAAGLLVFGGRHDATAFIAGYVTEYSLSVDNLFVFLLIMTTFAVPRTTSTGCCWSGILIALVMRGGFILAGAAVLSPVLLGLLPVRRLPAAHRGRRWCAATTRTRRTGRTSWSAGSGGSSRSPRTTTDGKLTVVRHGRRLVTPMLMVMIAIGLTDLLFALDSIPAIFGLTKDAYIVFTANAFALLGLRQLYFLLDGLL